jgi:hypothetical protein
MKMKYYFEVRDTKTGRLIRRTRKRVCRSFVIGFMQHLELFFGHSYNVGGDYVTIKDTGGTNRSTPTNQYLRVYGALEATGGDANYGILVGTGTTAVTTADYAVETQIAHGTGSGQLNHGATVVGGAVDAGSGCTMTISRQFGNASGGSITIRELCLVCMTHNGYYFLLSRDIVTQAVADGNTATAIIEISTTL